MEFTNNCLIWIKQKYIFRIENQALHIDKVMGGNINYWIN